MIVANLDKFREELPEHVVLVAVSKTKPVEDLRQAFDAGQRIFGENKCKKCLQNGRFYQKILNGILLDTCNEIK